jgi:hypothetical protein
MTSSPASKKDSPSLTPQSVLITADV